LRDERKREHRQLGELGWQLRERFRQQLGERRGGWLRKQLGERFGRQQLGSELRRKLGERLREQQRLGKFLGKQLRRRIVG
jgi:hypothetical protein